MAYIYMLFCHGGSLYTGITTDVAHRMAAHASGRGAKYTRAHRPLSLAALWETSNMQSAAQIEYRLKHLTPAKKRQLVENPCLLGTKDFPLPKDVECTTCSLPPITFS